LVHSRTNRTIADACSHVKNLGRGKKINRKINPTLNDKLVSIKFITSVHNN